MTYKPVSNFVAFIYIEEVKQKHGGVLPFAGMSAIDVSTGEVFILESYSQLNDDKLSLDEILRFIKSLSPKEIIIVKEKIQKLTDDYIIDYLNLNGQMFQFKEYNPEYNKIHNTWKEANFNFNTIKWTNYYPSVHFSEDVVNQQLKYLNC